MSLGIGVLGCGSVFAGPYAGMIERLRACGRVRVSAVFDVDERKRHGAARRYGVPPDLQGPEGVIEDDDVDIVLVLTSMNEHGPLTRAALEAGKHVLVEKPLATSFDGRAGSSSSFPARVPGSSSAHRTFCSARPSGRFTRVLARGGSGISSPRGPATAGPARPGPNGSTGRAGGRCSISGSTT